MWRLDVDKAELAAIAHDVCRVTAGKELLRLAREFTLPVTAIDEAFPVFLHGPVGAEVLRRSYGIEDDEILDPIRYHTIGNKHISAFDKVLLLADKLDPGKVTRYPFIGEVARLAREDLDEAMLRFIDHHDLVHPAMIAARNSALSAIRKRAA